MSRAEKADCDRMRDLSRVNARIVVECGMSLDPNLCIVQPTTSGVRRFQMTMKLYLIFCLTLLVLVTRTLK